MVTAATSRLGEAMCRALLGAGHRVLASDLPAQPPAGFAPWQGLLAPSGVALTRDALSYVGADLTRPRSVHELIYEHAQEHHVHTVIHLATHRSPTAARAAALDVEAVRCLLRECEATPNIERLVYRSFSDVYRVTHELPAIIAEDHPLEDSYGQATWRRVRIEADKLLCMRMGMGRLAITVVRCADILGRGTGSQLYDYLCTKLCLRPLGFDPMMNALALEDAVDALQRAAAPQTGSGVYNIAGRETLPLSAWITTSGRRDLALPGPMLAPLYALRRRALGTAFTYEINTARMHFPAILDGSRAAAAIGFRPSRSALAALAQELP